MNINLNTLLIGRGLALLCAFTLILLPACARPDSEDATIRIGVLPILDILPLAVADSAGYYTANNVRVELINVASAAERDQLFQAGEIDGMVTDLVALALINRNQSQLVGVRYAMRPTPGHAQFSIVSSPKSTLETASSLAGVDIALSEGTVIEYIATRMLESVGISGDAFQALAVPKMPDRLALLREGSIQAAVLPEPLASLALLDGGKVLIDDTGAEISPFSCSVYAFSSEILEQHPDAIKAVMKSVDQAVMDINNDKSVWDDLLTGLNLIPTPLTGQFALPDYPAAGVPSEFVFDDVTGWLSQTGRLDTPVAYQTVLSTEYID